MNGEQFDQSIVRAKRGDFIVYHIGSLMRDRLFDVDVAGRAQAAWTSYQDGRCLLVQRRVGDRFNYIAVKL